jgi:hypothetical protein
MYTQYLHHIHTPSPFPCLASPPGVLFFFSQFPVLIIYFWKPLMGLAIVNDEAQLHALLMEHDLSNRCTKTNHWKKLVRDYDNIPFLQSDYGSRFYILHKHSYLICHGNWNMNYALGISVISLNHGSWHLWI